LNSDTADANVPVDTSSGPPASTGEPPAAVADGRFRQLDPRRIRLEQTVSAIVGAVISGILLTAIPVLWLTRGSQIAFVAWLGWLVVTALLVWLAVRWPGIEYRHWCYRVDDQGIEIWSGVIWRQMIAVPRSRVQHIDVTQGPLERSYGLATLSVYTAGTQYSKVDLPGLDHRVAIALRDGLLPKDAEPAV
jgi:membrane protein YdbS with pleckstrin-like domain